MLGSVFFLNSLAKIFESIDGLPLLKEIPFGLLVLDVLSQVFFNL